MNHEIGLDKGSDYLWDRWVDSDRSCSGHHVDQFEKALKIYLDASGMVMVPREATDDMRYAWNVSEGNGTSHFGKQYYSDMIAAAPNPFQTPEESREKK